MDILKLFLEAREDKNPVISIIDGDERSVLLIAAAFGHLNIIVYYKDVLQFSNINLENNIGKTPLSVASFEGHFNVAEYYIKNGYKASSKVLTVYIPTPPHKMFGPFADFKDLSKTKSTKVFSVFC